MNEWLKDLWSKFRADLKKAHLSWTIWANTISGLIVVGLPFAQDNLPQLKDYLPANFYHYAMGAVVLANLALRFKTNCALAEKGKNGPAA